MCANVKEIKKIGNCIFGTSSDIMLCVVQSYLNFVPTATATPSLSRGNGIVLVWRRQSQFQKLENVICTNPDEAACGSAVCSLSLNGFSSLQSELGINIVLVSVSEPNGCV